MSSFLRNDKNKIAWIKLSLYALVIIPGALFVIVSIGNLAYIYTSRNYSEKVFPDLNPEDRKVFILAHGVRDSAASWCVPLKKILEEKNPGTKVIALDWRPYSDSTFRCSVDGRRIGQEIGRRLSGCKKLESIHLVGHSCGSFVIYGICETVKSLRPDVSIQSTYLDPVSIYGGLSWDYGVDHFGSCSDFSDAYIDTGDTIPGSNELLPNTVTFDVTAVREKSKYKGFPHVWPTVYYQELVKSGKNPELSKNEDIISLFPKGKFIKVME